jgi:hypothetical protein
MFDDGQQQHQQRTLERKDTDEEPTSCHELIAHVIVWRFDPTA